MKPFDLQAALNGAPVVTRDGRPVKIAGYNSDAAIPNQKILGWVDGTVLSWGENGNYFRGGSPIDLFMASTKKEGWVNIHRFPEGSIRDLFCAGPFDTEDQAKKALCFPIKFATTVKIEWEE